MSFKQFCISARSNIAGIMFNSPHFAETVNQHLPNATVIDNCLYFADPQATAVAIELAGIAEDDYCFVGAKCRLPFVPRDIDRARPCIYVACLAAYNNGQLHGMWIDATQDQDGIQADIEYMLFHSPEDEAEDWRIDDCEGFYGMPISEYQSIETVAELGQLVAEYGAAYAAYASSVGVEYATATEFEDIYRGEWDSESDFAENLMDECYTVPEHLQHYIDYEKFARDIFINDYYSAPGKNSRDSCKSSVYVFAYH